MGPFDHQRIVAPQPIRAHRRRGNNRSPSFTCAYCSVTHLTCCTLNDRQTAVVQTILDAVISDTLRTKKTETCSCFCTRSITHEIDAAQHTSFLYRKSYVLPSAVDRFVWRGGAVTSESLDFPNRPLTSSTPGSEGHDPSCGSVRPHREGQTLWGDTQGVRNI